MVIWHGSGSRELWSYMEKSFEQPVRRAGGSALMINGQHDTAVRVPTLRIMTIKNWTCFGDMCS